MKIDEEVGQRVQIPHRANVADFGTFQAECFGVAVAALGAGALPIDRLKQRAVSREGDTSESPDFPVEVFDAAFAFLELRMVTGLSGGVRKEQGTAKTLRLVHQDCCF